MSRDACQLADLPHFPLSFPTVMPSEGRTIHRLIKGMAVVVAGQGLVPANEMCALKAPVPGCPNKT